MTNDRKNEEEFAENDRRGIDNPELNRDKNNTHDKDRDFETSVCHRIHSIRGEHLSRATNPGRSRQGHSHLTLFPRP